MFDWLVQLLRPFSFRGKYRLLTALIPKQGQREACIFGVRSTLDLSDLIQRFIYLGCYEPLETAAVRKVLRPGMTFVDAGANIGYFTWLAARLVGPTGASWLSNHRRRSLQAWPDRSGTTGSVRSRFIPWASVMLPVS